VSFATRPWLEPAPVEVPDDLAAAVGGHPLVAATLVRRGITTPAVARAFLNPADGTRAPARALPGLSAAADRLEAALRAHTPICVWGDFDVDGQTATALLVSVLADLGGAVLYRIPLRSEGHGIGPDGAAQAIAAGARLILTCDTGISAHEAVAYARSQGVDCIITDHHDPPAVLPAAQAVVNPKLSGVANASPAAAGDLVSPVGLPGVGVAYKLAEELYARAGRAQAAAGQLDLVALGIVADLAEVRGETRALLQLGLAALRQTPRLGLQALMETAGLDPARLAEEHIGYVIAPRLNALGRLADANVAVEFLTLGVLSGLSYAEGGVGRWTPAAGNRPSSEQLLARARILAADLEALNGRRKLLCDQVYAAAEAQIRRDPDLLEPAALVLAGPGWHPGVIGIVASRLVERYGKPTVLLSLPPAGDAGPARGSARSVPGINITAAIAAHAHLLLGFGGHPMAAGLSLAVERIAEFRRALARTVEQMAGRAGATAGLAIDGYLPLGDLTLDLVADLERLAPFGPGNPPLTLVSRDLQVRGARPVGRDQAHLLVFVEDEWGAEYEVIWWDGAGEALPEGRFDLAYTVRANDYRGSRGLQVAWVAARPAGPSEVALRPAIAVVDCRSAADPQAALRALLAAGQAMVWSEGGEEAGAPGLPRHRLAPAARLIIWTAPPGPAELRQALRRVKPQTVYLFAADPGLDQPAAFMRRLAGLVKYALKQGDGRARISELAAALAAREGTVRLGLRWLVEAGQVRCDAPAAGEEATAGGDDEIVLAPGDGVRRPAAEPVAARLADLLAETAAYRAYFAAAAAEKLIHADLQA